MTEMMKDHVRSALENLRWALSGKPKAEEAVVDAMESLEEAVKIIAEEERKEAA